MNINCGIDVVLDDFSVVEIFIEMACNGLFGAGNNGLIQPPNKDKYYVVKTVKLAVKDQEITHLIRDFEILIGFVKVIVI